MQKAELKKEIQKLMDGNEAIFVESLNEVWLEMWKNDDDEIKDDLLLTIPYGSEWAEALKDKIEKEIGEQYVQDLSKFLTLLTVYINSEIIEEATSSKKAEEIESGSKSLGGLKEVVKQFDKENNW